MKKIILFTYFTASILVSGFQIKEAQQIVAQADSLLTSGELYRDSIKIAQAVQTFKPYHFFYPEDYAKANYYYGRLLREKGKQSEAMQCFLNVLHSRTNNNDLRGRVYTNVAVMCRLEGNHPLSYAMFDMSSKEFWENKDTVAYYYALNSMAFELAEQLRKDECLSLLSEIERKCKDRHVLIKTIETKAEAYYVVQQYDTAIYYVNLLQEQGNNEPTGMLIKAQSYSYMNQNDSAVYYAQKVVSNTASLFDLNNSYYILANADENAQIAEIQRWHAERSDIQKQIELRHAELSRALEILEQDMNKKPSYNGLILFVVLVGVIVISTLSGYSLIKHKRRLMLQEQKYLQNQKQQLQKVNDELIQQQEQIIENRSEYYQQRITEVEHLCEALRKSENLTRDLHWTDEKQLSELINSRFNFLANKLKTIDGLTYAEFKLCILVLIDLRFDDMARIIPYAQSSIGKLKDTAAKKIGTTGKNLRNYLLNMVIGWY